MKKKNGALDFLTVAKASGREKIELSGMDGIYARQLSAAEVRRISEACTLPGKKAADGEGAFDNDRMVAMMISASVVNEAGERRIPDGREAELMELPNATYMALQTAVLKVNGIGTPGGN